MKILSKIIFWLLGWRAIGTFKYPDKCVIIAAPHTSNWDFFIGRCYGYISGIRPKYLAKSSLFIPILGSFLKWNGCVPVDRDTKNNIVDHLVQRFHKEKSFMVGISPEGTRSRVPRWKSGFYYIAFQAKVPIILVGMDFKEKTVGVIGSIMPTGNIDEDMLFIQHQFKDLKGKIVDNYNPIIR